MIDPAQPIPIFVQLKALLMDDILRGRYCAGDRLPTEHDLCARYGISRTPVTRALSELADEGVVLRHRRRGTFVNPHWLQRNANGREVRAMVPEGPWATMLEAAAGEDVGLSIVAVELTELHQRLVQAVAAGQAPDVAVLDSVWVPEFAAAGFLRPLDELDAVWVTTEYEPDFLDAFVAANRHGGRPVAAQAEADVAGLWFRRQALADIGVSVPESWSDLSDVCARLVAAGRRDPLVLPGGSRAGEAASYGLLGLLAANGVQVLGPDRVTLDCPAAVECVTLLRVLREAGALSAELVGWELGRPIRQLALGQADLCIGGSYEGPAIAAAADLPPAELWREFGFARLPAGPSGPARTLAGGMVHAIFRQAAVPELAMRLVRAAVSPRALAGMSRQTGQIPSRRSAIALVASESEFLADTARMLDDAVVRPATSAYARLSAQLQALLETVLLGREDPAIAVRHTAQMIGAITGLPA
jgi:multiple sugar transport system substrate-binding protein